MAKLPKTTAEADLPLLQAARGYLCQARLRVRAANSPRAMLALKRAMNSLDGAIRHAQGVASREGRS